MSINKDCVENVLLRGQDISLQHKPFTNNRNENQPKEIVSGIMKVVQTFTKKYPKINTIITGMLPWDKTVFLANNIQLDKQETESRIQEHFHKHFS